MVPLTTLLMLISLHCAFPQITGIQWGYAWKTPVQWQYTLRFYLEETAVRGRYRTKRDVYNAALLTDGVLFRRKKSILQAVLKGGELEKEGFYRSGALKSNSPNAKLEFYRCFRSFRFLLQELKRAYHSHNQTDVVKHMLIYGESAVADKTNTTATTGKPTRNAATGKPNYGATTEEPIRNTTVKKRQREVTTKQRNSMSTISNLLLDDKENKGLISWLEKQVKNKADHVDALWHCKARVIVQYRCCWDTLSHNKRKHWGELHVLVG